MRYPDWPHRLFKVVEDCRDRPFCYGSFDCMLFAGMCVEAVTGTNYAKEFQGRYDSKMSAAKLIARHGSLQAMLTAILGDPLEHPSAAKRGDVVLMTQVDGEEIATVCVGAFAMCPALTGGLHRFPMSQALVAWAVK